MLDLQAVKDYLHITYNDSEIDRNIENIIVRSEKIIRGYVGISAETEISIDEEQLVLDCCRYIYNHAYEDFELNFRNELTAARDKRNVEAFKAEKEAAHGSQR